MNVSDFYDLRKKYGSPFYLLDFDGAKNRAAKISSRLPVNAKLCYAIKANPFLLDALKDEPLLFEVCSPGELSICEKYGVNPEKIVFSGVCKTQEDVERAWNLGVKTITLESKAHCDYVLEAAKKNPRKTPDSQEVILRLSGGNQFGMSASDIEDCINLLKKEPSIKIRGIHFFTGTQKKIKKIEEEIAFITEFCGNLQKKTGIHFTDIEYGPGLSFDYFAEEPENDFSDLDAFSALIGKSPFSFVVELGRFVASPCAVYLSTIMDIKSDGKDNYCIIDGGINHINYYGQMMGMKVPRVEHIRQFDAFSDAQNYTIAGSLCTTADIVLRKLPLSAPTIGDALIFGNIGAYSITEGIYLFLSHPLPAVLSADGKNIRVLRKVEETYILNS